MRVIILGLALLMSTSTWANVYSLPTNGSRLIGEIQHHIVQKGEYFQTIAKQYNVGILELMESNPGVDPFLPTPGLDLIIPTQMLLPDTAYKGIVINLPELRLYFYPKNKREVHVFPIGIGRVGRETPEMTTKIKARIPNPSWTPPASIRQEHLEELGEVLPRIVPAGPDNPLGKFAMQLAYGDGSYLIHGTNKDFGVGMRVSAGCIRLNPDDIEWLFDKVKYGEPVRIINQPVKFSNEPNGVKIFEVYSPLSRADGSQNVIKLSQQALKFTTQADVDSRKVTDALLAQSGLPAQVQLN